MIIKGIYHAHSKYSGDGVFAFEDIKKKLLERGQYFIIMTEHAEDLTPESYAAYYKDCKRYSDESFLFIPGLEIPYEGKVHVGCFPGLETYTDVPMYRAGIIHMRAHGALAIYHHPSKQKYYINNEFKEIVDGVEVWNARYEGKYAPSMKTLSFAKKYFAGKLFMGGLDLHTHNQLGGPSLVVSVNTLCVDEICRAIRNNQYTLQGSYFSYTATSQRILNRIWYYLVRLPYDIVLSLRKIF